MQPDYLGNEDNTFNHTEHLLFKGVKSAQTKNSYLNPKRDQEEDIYLNGYAVLQFVLNLTYTRQELLSIVKISITSDFHRHFTCNIIKITPTKFYLALT